ncbi:uncharacterized protein LOC110034394, partial [Phalaenopsis equestris]|uniref:uncharacterized protein LOC110034394 n=1 Tax=Phalaenopsis equestris TaxID=78828 RepID=UPI0009E27414
MLPRVFHADDGKDLSPKLQSRFFISSVMKCFLPFFLLASAASFFGYRYYDSPKTVLRTSSPLVFPCVSKEPSVFDRWIKPPSSLMHNMSDEELFRAASFAKEYPFNGVPKVAFMFLTRGPLPLSPLWERFFKGNEGLYSIYVHSLPGYKASFPPESVFYNRQIPSQ